MRAWPGHRLLGLQAGIAASAPAFIARPSVTSASIVAVGVLAGPILGDLPDIDQHIKFLPHRGPTHSLVVHWFLASLATGICQPWTIAPFNMGGLDFGGASYVGVPWLAPTIFWLVFLPLATHPFADLINTTGVAMFWPIPQLVEFIGWLLFQLLGKSGRDLGKILIRIGRWSRLISGPFAPHGIHQAIPNNAFGAAERALMRIFGAKPIRGGNQFVNPVEVAVEWGTVLGVAVLLGLWLLPPMFHVLLGAQSTTVALGWTP